jgi:flavin-dependent dehydrogenase
MYDVIVIGARCAGSPTAMLLARKGYKVLLVDKAEFPSDTISTHIIFPPGEERLKHWGLLEKVKATNCPVINDIGFNPGPFELIGAPPSPAGIHGIIAPRRILLDKILLDAAVDAGAEARENCLVEEIIVESGTVKGIRCKIKGGLSVVEKARIVIGADGRNSLLAKSVNAEKYIDRPILACWYYTYWSGVNTKYLYLYSKPNCAFGTIPTNDGLTCITLAIAASEFHQFRSDIEGNYMKTIALSEELAEIVNRGKREERFFAMSDLPNFFRQSYGPGWALAGDAGYHKDPITGQGISDAFYAADNLSEAIDAGFSGRESMETAMAAYQKNRDEKSMPMFGLTCDWASMQPPPPEMENLLLALRGNQVETNNFFGTLAGTVSIPEFYSPENMQRITGVTNVAN